MPTPWGGIPNPHAQPYNTPHKSLAIHHLQNSLTNGEHLIKGNGGAPLSFDWSRYRGRNHCHICDTQLNYLLMMVEWAKSSNNLHVSLITKKSLTFIFLNFLKVLGIIPHFLELTLVLLKSNVLFIKYHFVVTYLLIFLPARRHSFGYTHNVALI